MTTLQTARAAPIWKRVVAGAIDFAVLAMLVWPAVRLAGFGDVDVEIEFTRTTLGQWFPFLLFMGLWLFPFCLRDLVGGRSLGKWLLGVRVVDSADAGTTPDARRLILRNLTIWLSPVGLALAAMHPDRMRFGDRLARTMVVEEPVPREGPSWRQTALKAACFSLVAVGCLAWWRDMTRRYHEGSRVYRLAVAHLNGGAEIRELIGGLSTDNLTLAGFYYGPTAEGAATQLDFTHRAPPRQTSVTVVMKRPADNVAGWYGAGTQAKLDPPPAAENVTGSTLNAAALAFLKTYEPLHAAVRDLRPEKTTLAGAVVFVEKGTTKAAVWYARPPDRWSAQFQVMFDRKQDPALPGATGSAGRGAWEVSDASGFLDLNLDNATGRRMFVFLKSKDLHRYLTADEAAGLMRNRPLTEVLPELKAMSDNATGAK